MRISDWSSDVCSSDLRAVHAFAFEADGPVRIGDQEAREIAPADRAFLVPQRACAEHAVGGADAPLRRHERDHDARAREPIPGGAGNEPGNAAREIEPPGAVTDRMSDVYGKSVSSRVDHSGRSI